MKILDSLVLARTKQQTRRLRRWTTSSLCVLLFALLLTGSFLASGMIKSASQLQKYGYNGQYLATATANFQNANMDSAEKTAQAEMDAELRNRKIAVTDVIRQSESYQTELSRRKGVKLIELSQANSQKFQRRVEKEYRPTAVYQYDQVESMNNAQGITEQDKDPFLTQQRADIQKGSHASQSQTAANQNIWSPPPVMHVEQALIQSALQPGQTFNWEQDNPYPIVIPYTSLPRLAGKDMTKLSPTQVLATYKELIARYTGSQLTYCYRNQAAQSQTIATLQYNKAAESDKDPKTTPLSVPDCQPLDQKALQKIGIVADPKASTTEKPLFTHTDDAPITQVVTFKIVGFIPTQSYGDEQNKLATIISGVNNWGSAINPGLYRVKYIAKHLSLPRTRQMLIMGRLQKQPFSLTSRMQVTKNAS